MRRIVCVALCALVVGGLLRMGEAEAHSGTWIIVKPNGTFLRTCPATTCGKVVLAPNGAKVRLDRHRGTWAYAYYGDFKGWLSLGTVRSAAPAAQPVASAPATCFANTWGQVVCAEQWVANEVYAAANAYGVSFYTLMALAACESNFNYNLVEYSGATGLFQYLPSTWDWIGMGSIWSVHDQARTTAWAFANGLQSHWVCYYRI